jgi:pimeloyl-ACP methyl ester carboxylesterase
MARLRMGSGRRGWGRAWRAAVLVVVFSLTAAASANATTGAFAPSPLQHVRANGISIGYHTIGSGSPLVMIMGFSGTQYIWDPALLARLAEQHRVIVFDNRGVLTSTRGQAPLSIALMADDTAALIRALGYRRADVLGWSMGGNIAEMLALQHPGRVRRLILAATDPGGPHAIQPTNPLAVHVLNDPNATTAQVLKVIFPQTAAGTAAQKAYVQRLFGWPAVTPNDFSASPSITREQSVAEGQRHWYCRTCGAYPRLGSVRARTLVADGRKDIVEPTQNSRLISRRIPGAKLALFTGSGHAFLFQDHGAVASRITRFLR